MTTSRVINATQTDVLLQPHGDRNLVLITQLGKVGCLIQAAMPPAVPLPPLPPLPALPPVPPSIALTPLIGQPPSGLETLYNLYASQVATLLWVDEGPNGPRKPVVVGIALKRSGPLQPATEDDENSEEGLTEVDRDTFQEVMEMVRDTLKTTPI